MDKTLISGKEPEYDSSGKEQPDDVEMEEAKKDSPNRTTKPDQAEEELTEGQEPDSSPEEGVTLCTVCGFSAKCPRSLKIHFARKHGKNSKNTNKAAKLTDKGDLGPAEIEYVVEMETESGAAGKQNQQSDLDELKSAASDNDMNMNCSTEKETATSKRRLSKRTPKPKVIYSCNYCGQEFRDKSPLDVHIQRYHAKDTPYSFDGDENVVREEEAVDPRSVVKASPVKVAAKRTINRFQLKCASCDFRVPIPALLESHARVKHLDEEWYRCKLCNFFAATSQWMDFHLSSDTHLQQHKLENSSESSSFEAYVERVNRDSAGFKDDIAQLSAGEEEAAGIEGDPEAKEEANVSEAVPDEEEDSELEPPKKKRGRPKHGSSTTCGYCGLVVSNATNLSVHVRRKHSKEYGYSCTLCNYSCVTKGDMDRHCVTKKHVRRALECANKKSVNNDTGESLQEPTTKEVQEPNVSESADTEQKSDDTSTKESSAAEPSQPDTSQTKNNMACDHCDFVAQSVPSLNLHIKRRHTKDFEFVCLACSYYAVTCREMTRHANTEKHKQKSQKYLESTGGDAQKALSVPLKLQEVIELVGTNSNSELDPLSPTEESESDDDSPAVESQETTEPSATAEPGEAVSSESGHADEKQAENMESSGADEPANLSVKPAAQSEDQETPAEPNSAADPATQPENQDVGAKQTEDKHLNSDPSISDAKQENTPTDTQIFKAVPFDSCIVSMKALAEQEQTLQDLEGQAAVICLTGGTPVPTTVMFSDASYVKKLSRREQKVREDTKGSSSRIRCEDCGFMADGVSGLNVHISMKHPTKDKHFHCLVCGKSFYTESNLHQHLTSAAHLRNEQNSVEELPEGGAHFKCVKCTDRFETEQDLFIHIKEKHEELLREVNKYVLEDTEQINREREENQGSVCKYCGKVCKSSNSMAFLAHIRTHTGSKPFICKICNFATAQLGDARNHVKRHLGMREYKCDICGWAFVMKKHLSTHLLGKHGVGQRKERKFECNLCERSFSEKWALNNHMKLHSGEKPYKCAWPSCHYAFLNLSAMKDHYRTHTGEKSYLCDLCGFAGGTRHALTKHRRQHTGERPFKCKLCDFASTTQSHLSRHKRIHTGEKPYRCPWCDYRSNCAENIRKHILHTGKHEGVKMYNCPKCPYATNSPMEFRNHLKENHHDIENPDLAYLHAGIVSKSFECRLKGQGAAFVEAELVESPVSKKSLSEVPGHDDSVQQVIIIQGYSDGEVAIDQTLEESAAATLQTLAMAGQVAEVLHITEDGQVIASGREVASAGAHLAGGSTQYVVLESGEAREGLRVVARGGVGVAGQSQSVASESSTALDALLSAVSEMGQQEEMQREAAVVHEVVTPEIVQAVQIGEAQPDVKQEQEQEEVQVIQETSQEGMQEVLQLAASQMMKEGLTQVIVNDEGTHYIVTELDNCTLQVEGSVYGEAAAVEEEVQQTEQQEGEEMVVYLDGASHNIVLEG
ncbi:zinc finger protein 407 [Halichoeres trimaculatus]|uniref:zinc finger protein 407 n=1 Tax=Halichoeres trimaculatus TaxID=147232 RepID=UPI003D9E3368